MSEETGPSWRRQLKLEARVMVQLLSPREKEVLVHLMQGRTNKAIARALWISPRTVEIHRANMMRKLEARSTADAIRIALYAELDEEEPR